MEKIEDVMEDFLYKHKCFDISVKGIIRNLEENGFIIIPKPDVQGGKNVSK